MSAIRPLERRQLTVMLCDLVGSTALSLSLDPEELTEVIQAYRRRCADLIAGHGGFVAQYVGDGILAYFGYPRAHEDDAERAIRAALGIAAAARQASPAVAELDVHIGIATGLVVVGDLSGGDRRTPAEGAAPGGRDEISAVGNAPNLAARLQALAGPGAVVVSEQTRRLCGAIFEYRDLGRHELKGFDQPVQAWQALRESKVRSRFHALRASVLTPLMDRREELQQLRQLWDGARSGRGRAVLLSAEAGAGKSRLAEEVARGIAGRRCLRLWYYCSPHLQSSPLAPLVRQLTLAAGFKDGDGEEARLRKLMRLLPEGAAEPGEAVPLLASLLSIPYEGRFPPLNMSPQRQKQRLFEVLMQMLAAFAARGPVLLVVEDLHWVDPSSDELIGILIDRLRDLPVLAILTARREFQSHWDDRAQLLPMSLGSLAREDSIAMIGMICGDRRMPEATVHRIADETDGLPLFIEDLTRDVLELAELQEGGSGAALPRAPLPFSIPTTLSDSLSSRLDRLGSAKAVAQVGAAIGREFPYELLVRVADLPEDQLKEEISRLVDSGLLMSRRSSAVLAYAFKHALVRDAAYASLLKKEQAALHARIARTLAEEFPDAAETQPEILAHHFQAARDVENAVHYLVRAAKLSARRSGFVEAIAQLQRALSLLATQPGSRARTQGELRAHLALGGIYAQYRGFSATETGAAFNAALDRCRELGDAPEIFAVLSGVGAFEITRANVEKCRALAAECLSRAALQRSRPPFIMGHLLLGGALFLTGELTSARRHLEQAIADYEQDRTAKGRQVMYVQDQKSTGLCYLASALTILGYPDRGLRAAESGLAHSRSLGGLHAINYSLCYLGAVLHLRRDAREALRCATESLELAREQGFASWLGMSLLLRGASRVGLGEHEEGLRDIAEGIEAHSGMEAGAYQPFALSMLAGGLLATGRAAEARAALDRALAIAEQTGERFYLAELLRLKGEALAREGSLPEAERCLREAIELAARQDAKLLELRAAASLCRLLDGPRKVTALREILAPVHDWFQEGAHAPDLRDARALLAVTTAGLPNPGLPAPSAVSGIAPSERGSR